MSVLMGTEPGLAEADPEVATLVADEIERHGSKEGLLVAALTGTFRQGEQLAEVVGRDLDTLGEQIIGYVLSVWEKPASRDVLIGMIRSTCKNARAARMLRDFFAGQILARIAGALPDDEAELRAGAVGSQIVGLAFYRYVLKVEPIASASPETLRATFAPTLQRYLTGPLGLPRGAIRDPARTRP